MTPEGYYNHMSECIDTFAQKGDLIMHNLLKEEDYETMLSLACMYTGFYGQPFPFDIDKTECNEKEAKRKRKELGQYFTPAYIAKYIVETTLGPLVANKTTDEILELKVCDPAMGAGIFLTKAHDYIFESLIAIDKEFTEKRFEELSLGAMKCIYGVDIDEKAVSLAKTSMHLNHAKHCLIWKIEEYVDFVKKSSL